MKKMSGVLIGLSAAVSIAVVGFIDSPPRATVSQASTPQRPQSGQATPSQRIKSGQTPPLQRAATPSAALEKAPLAALPTASRLLQGLSQPLTTLREMQRSVLTSETTLAANNPLIAVLTANLTTTGLGPAAIGQTLDELADQGVNLVPMEGSRNSSCQYYRLKDSREPLGFMVVDNRLIRIDVWPGSITETLSGIKIGSSAKRVYEAYGTRIESLPNPFTKGEYLVFTPSNPGEALYRLVFETDPQGKIVQYRTGQFPAVAWAEGCL